MNSICDKLLEDIKLGWVRLPRPPETYNKVVAEVDGDCDYRVLRDLIQFEPSLAARILHVANSAAFFTGMKYTTIEAALNKLGTAMIKSIVLCAGMRDSFHSTNAHAGEYLRRCWVHSVRVGVMSYVFAKNLRVLNASEALTCGVLHDIGVLPIVDRMAEMKELDDAVAEYASRIGQSIVDEWQLPGGMEDIVTLHYNDSPVPGKLVLADIVAIGHYYCDLGVGSSSINIVPRLAKLGIDLTHLEVIASDCEGERRALEQALGI